MNNGLFYYTEGTDLKYKASYQSNNKKMSIDVYDRKDLQIGKVIGEKDKNRLSFSLNINLDNKNYDVTYNINYKEKQKDSYIREDILNFKYMKDNIIQIKGNIESTSHISSNPKIQVDTDSSILRSSLTEDQEQQLKTRKENIIERLEK